MRRPDFRRGRDDLGLRRALQDWLLPALVGAMAFLAALAWAGALAAASLAETWQHSATAALTIQVPRPGEPAAGGAGASRAQAVAAVLEATPGLTARLLGEAELAALLRPWLGADAEKFDLPLPAVFAVRLAAPGGGIAGLEERLTALAPGTLVERHQEWQRRLTLLARSLQACALIELLVVGGVAAAVVAAVTRSGLAARREAIEIVHLLGATDSYIAGRFAFRATWLAGLGAVGGSLAALLLLALIAGLAVPPALWPRPDLPAWLATQLWPLLLVLPAVAAAIGWITAQGAVRRWLRRYP